MAALHSMFGSFFGYLVLVTSAKQGKWPAESLTVDYKDAQ
jgi:hypothetical protein